ncbi:fused uroporphyrinogen-III synthase HemD/membrane protein HemX [Mycetohabitans rhizoxinica]|uniref:fused uroporphyrinogen-III synthase HemD/membrane protein HemX n=1 Tax=Mycetohabitans rhizoxinica TaxID=412963 RepID=UPI0023512957|nr:fused uroporphyrinogen-III synthase HemD/membrane protein HemX [Mycetohabitans sp. B2]
MTRRATEPRDGGRPIVTQASLPPTSQSAAAGDAGAPVAARPTVVITRPAGQSAELLTALAATGLDGFEFPLIDITDATDNAPLVDGLLDLERYALAVFVSPNAVDRAFAALAAARPKASPESASPVDVPPADALSADASSADTPSAHASAATVPPLAFSWPTTVPVAGVGPGTVRALARHGVQPHTHRIIAPGDAVRVALQAPVYDGGKDGGAGVSYAGEPPRRDDTPAVQVSSDSYASGDAPRYDSEALIDALATAFAPHGLTALQGQHVLLVRGDGGRELLAETLRAHGAIVQALGAYQRRLPEPSFDAWQRVHALLAGQPHAWVLTSSEGVRNLEELAREHLNRDEIVALKRAPIVTPHPRIGDTARKAGFDTITVSGAGDQAIVGALRAVFSPITQAASFSKTQSQSAQLSMTDSKDSQPAPGGAPQAAQPARPAAANVPPAAPFPPYESKRRRRSVSTALAWIGAVLVLAGAGAGGYVLERKVERLQQQLIVRQQASDAQSRDTRLKADEAASAVRQLDSQLAQLAGRVGDVQTQHQALQASLQDLAKDRDDWTLAEVEQTISSASQQLQLTGNVGLALLALQSADTRLAASTGAQVIAVRKAIAQDIDKLKAAPSVDLAGLAIKLDDVIAQVDALPLAGEAPAVPLKSRAGTPADVAQVAAANGEPRWKAWWHTFAADVMAQLTGLVQVRRIDNADAMLVAPDQGYLLRENVKLRLLCARVALLSRDEKLMKADLQAAQQALARYFDPSAQATHNARERLDQVQKGAAHIELPNLEASLNAIHQNKGRG